MKDLHELFVSELKSIYSAEQQIVKALPEFIEATSAKKMKEVFRAHLEETKTQITRLDAIFTEINETAAGAMNLVMESLIKEAQKAIAEDYVAEVRDAALINCAQHIEHYEIASYGVLKAFATHFNFKKIHDLLELSSKEEGNANKKLNKLAEGSIFTAGVNTEAMKKRAA